jgi:hypothetical protein
LLGKFLFNYRDRSLIAEQLEEIGAPEPLALKVAGALPQHLGNGFSAP